MTVEKRDVILHGDNLTLLGRKVHAMAINETSGKLIVARKPCSEGLTDDTLEQYNVLIGWLTVPEKVIAPCNGSIESLSFVADNIIATHLNGSISISSPHSDDIKVNQISPAPLWASCAVDDRTVALVSDTAMLYLFDTIEGIVKKSLSMGLEKRLFSVAALKDTIAIGATDAIFLVGDGVMKRNLTVARKEKRLTTIVWSVVFVRPTLLVSGDSRGMVTFWNPQSGVMLSQLLTHQADVLSLCNNEGKIFAAGVDPRIVVLTEGSNGKFHIQFKKRGPTRDVKAMVKYERKVFAAGDDHVIYDMDHKDKPATTQFKSRVQTRKHVNAVAEPEYVDLFVSRKQIEDLPSTYDPNNPKPILLARVYAPKKQSLVAWDLSANGHTLVLSSSLDTSVYRVHYRTNKPIEMLPLNIRRAHAVKALSKSLLMCCGDFALHRISYDSGEGEVLLEQQGCGSVTKLIVSPDEKLAALITSRAELYLVDLVKGESKRVRVELPIDAEFTKSGRLFVLTGASGKEWKTKKTLFEFDRTGSSVGGGAAPLTLLEENEASRMVSLSCAAKHEEMIVTLENGSWIHVGENREAISGPFMSTVDSDELYHKVTLLREDGHIWEAALLVEPPTTAPFKLKKFGQQ